MASHPYRDAVLATSGLVSIWELGEEEGAAADLKGANPGAYNGSPSRAQVSVLPNAEGRCVGLTPTSQFVGVPSSSALNVADTFTLEAWIKPNTVNANRGIMSRGGTGFYMRVGSAGKLELLKSQTSVVVAATEALTANTAYHVAITKSAATVKLYINGADKTGTVTNATIADPGNALNIGGDTGFSTERFDGKIQFPAIFNVALSPAVVAEHKAAAEAAMTAESAQFFLGHRRAMSRVMST